MGKIDKSQYTKSQWKAIRERRRLDKQIKREGKRQTPLPTQSISTPQEKTKQNVNLDKLYILCLKHGSKYSSEYVNRLYKMCKRNCSIDFEFVCLTEDPKDINENITIIPLPQGLEGWWCKPYIFSKDLPLDGTVLYMDLDVVLSGSIDKLFTFEPDRWCIIRDFTRRMRPQWQKYNSSVIRFNKGQLDHLWQEFSRNKLSHMRKHFGDQDFIYEMDKSAKYWPDKWIMSWKWEIRKSREFAPGGRRGSRKLKNIEDVVPPEECCITVFHGDPNPDNCDDPWVKKNWN